MHIVSSHTSVFAAFTDDIDIMSTSDNRAHSVGAQSDRASSYQPSTIQKGTDRPGVDTPASLSSSLSSHESVGEGPSAHSHMHDESRVESGHNIFTSSHASPVTTAALATCLAENDVRPRECGWRFLGVTSTRNAPKRVRIGPGSGRDARKKFTLPF